MDDKNKEYYSCDIIEHGFDAQIDSINLCCRIANEKENEKVVLFPNYKGEKLDWQEFFKKTNELRTIQKQGGTVSQCEGCIYLKKQNWSDENYINSVNINNWIKCNARCTYCDRKYSEHKKAYKIFPIIKELIKNNWLRNPADITIAGGEPTITSDFDKTIKLLIKNNISTVRVLTNAIKYNRYIADGLKKGLVNICVSTDSGTREVYKKIKLVDKHADVWKNIKKYASVQKEKSLVKTKFIIMQTENFNEEEITAFIDNSYNAGVKHVYIDVEINWYRDIKDNQEIIQKIYSLFLYAKEIGSSKGMEIEGFDRIRMIKNKII